MIQTAIILAGGFGTRLQTVVKDVPKPMAPVCGRPFLDFQLARLNNFEFNHVILSTGHLADTIKLQYANGYQKLNISFSHEALALGTGGGIRQALSQCKEEEVLVLNGDSFFELPILDFYKNHLTSNRKHSLALREVQDASRYGRVVLNNQNCITKFGEKDGLNGPGYINAGVYILNKKDFLEKTPVEKNFSIEHDFFQTQASSGCLSGFLYDSYFIDIGIPEDYQQAQNDFKRFTDK